MLCLISLIFGTQGAAKLLTTILLFFPPSKQGLLKLFRTIKSSLCENFVYKVERSKLEIEFAFLSLLRLLIASITGFLFRTSQKVLRLQKTYIYHYLLAFV